ncbi:Uncharacterized protein APZ42_020872 [Daphnia magna]|uniref:Uncharacterized protein n=1 Tax=Daphnia magna TaxID=35525 RepID=A0A164XG80_9CRUS|nr:Uncharacterized protein APZ42_020872 [Daphnia magna]
MDIRVRQFDYGRTCGTPALPSSTNYLQKWSENESWIGYLKWIFIAFI